MPIQELQLGGCVWFLSLSLLVSFLDTWLQTSHILGFGLLEPWLFTEYNQLLCEQIGMFLHLSCSNVVFACQRSWEDSQWRSPVGSSEFRWGLMQSAFVNQYFLLQIEFSLAWMVFTSHSEKRLTLINVVYVVVIVLRKCSV